MPTYSMRTIGGNSYSAYLKGAVLEVIGYSNDALSAVSMSNMHFYAADKYGF
jgi:hypothetical protein